MAVYFHLKRGEESDMKTTQVATSSSFIVWLMMRREIKTFLSGQRDNNLLMPFMAEVINYRARISPGGLIEDLPINYQQVF